MRKFITTGMAVAMLVTPSIASAAPITPAYTTDTVGSGGSISVNKGVATFNVPTNAAYGVIKVPQTDLKVKDIKKLNFESNSSAGGGMVYMSVVTNEGHKIKYTPYEQTNPVGGYLPELGGVGSWYTHNPMAAGVRLNGINDGTPTLTWADAVSELGDETVNRVSITAGASSGHGTVMVDDIEINDSIIDFNDGHNDGKDGVDGEKGEKGDKGDTGSTGATGANGTNGVNGTDGAAGRNGVDGKSGVNGTNGVTTIIREQVAGEQSKLIGATVRTLTVPSLKGGKLVSVKATLRNQKLAVSGRKIKVDLTGKTVGNYNVSIIAKFKKHGKIRTVREVRSLSITLVK